MPTGASRSKKLSRARNLLDIKVQQEQPLQANTACSVDACKIRPGKGGLYADRNPSHVDFLQLFVSSYAKRLRKPRRPCRAECHWLKTSLADWIRTEPNLNSQITRLASFVSCRH